jgi:tetrapyrrole methylase family protein/MazG family protein
MKKLNEELHELAEARREEDACKVEEELGDILFTLVNLSRFLSVDAETALNGTIDKFLRRFAYIVKQLTAHGRSINEATIDEMDAFWNEAKKKET